MKTNEPQTLTLHIERVQSGLYRTEVHAHGVQVTEESMHASIAEAIREEAQAVPDDFAHFMEVRYCGLSSGTIALSELPQQAEEVGRRLVALLAEMHQIAERSN